MNKYASRKFIVAIAGIVFAGLAAQYPEYKSAIGWISGIVMTYIGAEAHVDGKAAQPKSEPILPVTSLFGSLESRADSE